MRKIGSPTRLLALILGAFLAGPGAAPAQEVTFSGGASMSFGYIVQSSDTTNFHYSGNRIQTLGGQFHLKARFNDKLTVNAGLGILERHYPSGSVRENAGRTPMLWTPYIVDADFRYAWADQKDFKASLTGGYFPYSYNPDVKNLGLYLLRGPVYPGILISGFELKHTRPAANTFGLRFNLALGGFQQDFLLNSETELYPLFDISPAYLASYAFGKALRLCAGVNFYHLIPVAPRITSPNTLAYDGSDAPANFDGDPTTRTWVYVDTVTRETSFLSFKGTKVAADFAFDPKAFFDADAFGAEDLRLYGEVAVLGLSMDKAHKAIYGGYSQRMPVMIGFNLPCFKLLDHVSIEVEHYGARFKDDLARYQSTTGAFMSPLPVTNRSDLDLKKDDWKWSVHAQKSFGQVRISGQVANDHSRPGGTITSSGSEWETFFVTPSDMYWVLKAGYSF
jgi:hypothetical protein